MGSSLWKSSCSSYPNLQQQHKQWMWWARYLLNCKRRNFCGSFLLTAYSAEGHRGGVCPSCHRERGGSTCTGRKSERTETTLSHIHTYMFWAQPDNRLIGPWESTWMSQKDPSWPRPLNLETLIWAAVPDITSPPRRQALILCLCFTPGQLPWHRHLEEF